LYDPFEDHEEASTVFAAVDVLVLQVHFQRAGCSADVCPEPSC